jgi:hypothetical protein
MKALLLYTGLMFIMSTASYSQSDTASQTTTRDTEFPGGVDSLYRLLEQSFRIMRSDHGFNQYEELVGDVRLTINKKGEVVTVNSGLTRIEYELERALLALPPFTPALVGGKPVTSYVELKFLFFIKGNHLEVTDHLSWHTYTRTKDTGWLKAGMIGVAVILFLLLWGV